jgi:VanZ family protein
LLTTLLLVPDPLALLGIKELPGPDKGRGVHFCAFALLGLLALASRLPLGTGRLVAYLVLYALATETLQMLVESRSVELLDYVENLAGLACGAAVGTLLARIVGPRQ